MRKKPKQQRSIQLVETIIEGARLAIIDYGLGHVTTHHIAEKSGVSVGSIYQYFHNKEEILEAMVNKLIAELVDIGGEFLATDKRESFDASLRRGLEHILIFVNRDKQLHLELISHWHLFNSKRLFDELEKHFIEILFPFLMGYPEKLPTPNLRPAMFIAVNSIIFTMMRYLSQPTPYLDDDELLDHMGRMIGSLLIGKH